MDNSNRIDKLVIESKGKQAKGKFVFSMSVCGPHFSWVFLIQIIGLGKFFTGVFITLGFSDSRYNQPDKQDLSPKLLHPSPLSTVCFGSISSI